MNYRLLLLLVLLLPFGSLQAQKKDLKKGNKFYDSYQYAEAIPHFVKALEKDSSLHIALIRLADCYRLTSKYAEAEKHYRQVVDKGIGDPINRYNFGIVLKYLGKYAEAKRQFDDYTKLVPSDPRGGKMAFGCVVATELVNQQGKYVSKRLTGVSTTASEFSPALYGNAVVFASSRDGSSEGKVNGRTGMPYTDLYLAKGALNSLGSVEPFSVFNSLLDDGPASFTQDGNFVVFTRSALVVNNPDLPNPNTAVLKLYSAEKVDDKWVNIKALPFNSNSFSCGHPALSSDGKTLYFTSNMPGGFGGTDLYVVTRNDGGGWSSPKNLGATINTEGNEMFPFYHTPTKQLFFSSDMLPGLGGLDVFVSKGELDAWTKPENMLPGINTSFDDFGLLLASDGNTGLLSSNRPGGPGADDLFFLELRPAEQPVVQKPDPLKPGDGGVSTPVEGDRVGSSVSGPAVKGSIVELLPNGGKGSPLDGVNLTVLQQQKTIGSGNSANGGKFDLPVTDPSGKLVVVARKSGYFTNRIEVDANNLGSLYNIEMERIVLNEPTSKMPATMFNLNSYQLSPEEQSRLNQVVTVLQDNPDVRMELAGHTCPLGPANYNLVLSQQRAEAVKQFLVSRGVNPNYLRAVGYGESQLKVPNPQTEAQFAANRRTEFVVIGYGSNAPAASEIPPLPGATGKAVEAPVGTTPATTSAKPNCPHHYNGRCFDLVDGKFYIVKPGDTVYGVSKAFGVTVEDLMSFNKLKSTLIVVNQKLQVKK